MRRHLRTTLAAEVVADPHAGPMCLQSLVQYMTQQIPPPALRFARWYGVPIRSEPDGRELLGYFVEVVWPGVEYV